MSFLPVRITDLSGSTPASWAAAAQIEAAPNHCDAVHADGTPCILDRVHQLLGTSHHYLKDGTIVSWRDVKEVEPLL